MSRVRGKRELKKKKKRDGGKIWKGEREEAILEITHENLKKKGGRVRKG